jgi:hypothetical protein
MRKARIIITFATACLAICLAGCGGSGAAADLERNTVSTTIDLQQTFLYGLDRAQPSLTGSLVVPPEEEDEEDEAAAEEGEEAEEEGLSLLELAESPFPIPGAPVDLALAGSTGAIYVLDESGLVRQGRINDESGLPTLENEVPTGVQHPRLLRLSDSGDALAVLGDSLAVYQLGADGQLSAPSPLPDTRQWVDVRLEASLGAASTSAGAVSFRWSPGEPASPVANLALPGSRRGQLVDTGGALLVLNSEDNSLSELALDGNATLSLLSTEPLPEVGGEPRTLAALEDGQRLVVGGDHFVLLLERDEQGALQELGEVETAETPSALLPVPDTDFVLLGHSQTPGFEVLEAGQDGPVLESAGPEQGPVSAFGLARRTVRVTRTVSL